MQILMEYEALNKEQGYPDAELVTEVLSGKFKATKLRKKEKRCLRTLLDFIHHLSYQ